MHVLILGVEFIIFDGWYYKIVLNVCFDLCLSVNKNLMKCTAVQLLPEKLWILIFVVCDNYKNCYGKNSYSNYGISGRIFFIQYPHVYSDVLVINNYPIAVLPEVIRTYKAVS